MIGKILHTHDFTYSATGATITATCGTEGCTLTNSQATLTIEKPTLTTYGETGKSAAATLTGLDAFNTATNKTIAATDIKYVGRDGTTYTESTTAPSNAGKYTASITVEEKTASVDYEIAKANPTTPTGLTATYGQTLANVTLPTGWTWVDSTQSVGNVVNPAATFKANFAGDDNHNAASNVDVTVTVGKADPTAPTSLTATYGQTLANVTLPDGWTWADSTQSVGNVVDPAATFKANFAGNDNYNAASNVDVTVTVGKADPTAPTGLTATYGQTLADVTLPDGWTWADSTQSVGNVVDPAATFKANFAGNDNYNAASNVDVTVTVGKADPTAPTGLTATYGQTLANVTLPDGWTWADSTQSVGNVVDPAATFKANFAGNDNYNAASNVEVTVTVGKANAVAATVTANNRTYDGTEKPLVTVAGETIGGTLKIAVTTVDQEPDDGAYTFDTTSIPTATNAGTYYVWYKVVGDENHTDTAPASVRATIRPASIYVTRPTGLTAVYGQKLSDVKLPAGWYWSSPSTSVGNAGTKTFYAYYPSYSSNYYGDSAYLTVTVAKADPEVELPTDLTATYGDKLSSVTLPEGWAWDDPGADVGNAGENEFPATYTPEDTDNYNTVPATLTVKVEKADPAVETPTDLTATYGGKLSDVTLPEGWSWDDPDADVGNAGEHEFPATYTPEDTDNYNTVPATLTVKVEKADPETETPTDLTATYGDKLSDVILPEGWAWDDPDADVGKAGENEFSATYTPMDTDNYNTVPATLTVKVAKADPETEAPTDLTATYGDKLSDVKLPEGWAWDEPDADVGDAGENEFSATYTPMDTDNYNTVPATLTVKVAKADPETEAPTDLTATYGDKLSDVTLPEGWTWDDLDADVGKAGENEFSATYTPKDTDNYNTVPATLTVKVEKADPEVETPADMTATYGDKLSDVKLPEGWSWDDPDASVGDAGEHEFAATYTPADTDNYNTVQEKLTVKVEKAPQTPVEGLEAVQASGPDKKDGRITGTDKTMEYSADGGKTWTPVTGSTIDNLPAGDYQVRRAGDGNHEPSEAVTVTVPAAKPTPTPTPTAKPTATPTATPTVKPTATPTAAPTAKPTATPTVKPTVAPTVKPTAEPEDTPAPLLIAQATASGKTALTIKWNKVKDADGYEIFLAKCNDGDKKYELKKIKTVKGNKTFKFKKSGLNKNASYKASVKAYKKVNGKKVYLAESPTVHAYTANEKGKSTNAKSVSVKKSSVTLKVGKTSTVKATVTLAKKKLKLNDHVDKLRYYTTDPAVATVNEKGKIKAVGKGSCTIYVIAHNGLSAKVKVKVK